ncbi:MAG: NRDE family protein [Caulobacteraceae bacterium]
MCVLALAFERHPRWRLALAGNRDELHARPAAALHRWDGFGRVLAGQDLQSGGTWLGVSEAGRLAVVTNLRGYGPPEEGRPSRGLLLRDLLAGDGDWASPSDDDLDGFNPFNLFAMTDGQLMFRTNRPKPERRVLGPGLYGASNGPLDAPWPKTVRLKAALEHWLETGAGRPEMMLNALMDDRPPPAEAGPPSDAPEPPQTPIFIRNPLYGTRCSTVVVIDHDGRGTIVERRYDAEGQAIGETALEFSWPW